MYAQDITKQEHLWVESVVPITETKNSEIKKFEINTPISYERTNE